MLCVGRAIQFREEVFTDWKGLNLGRHTLLQNHDALTGQKPLSNSKDDHRNMMLGLLQFFEYIIAETKDIEIR